MVSLLAVVYIVFISLGLPDSMFGVSWPVIHLEFGIAESFASVFSIITGVCSGGVSFIAGFLIRKFGTPKVTLMSIFLTCAGLLGISFSNNIIVMMIFSVILSYGAGAIDTGLNNYAALHFEARHMNWLHCFWGVGVTTSPLIMSVFLNDTASWRNGYRVVALIQFAIALGVALYLKTWQKFDKENTTATEEKTEKQKEKINIFKIKGLFTSILSQGFYCCMEFLIGTWGASFLINTGKFSPETASRFISLYYLGIMLGRLVAGFVSIKATDNTLIRSGAIISFFGILILAIPSPVSPFGLLLIGFGCGPVFPSILHSVPERFGKEYSADITGIHMGGAYTVGFGAQLVFGYLATATTFKIMPFILIAFCVLLFIMNELTIRKTKTN